MTLHHCSLDLVGACLFYSLDSEEDSRSYSFLLEFIEVMRSEQSQPPRWKPPSRVLMSPLQTGMPMSVRAL